MQTVTNRIQRHIEGWKVQAVPLLLDDEILKACCLAPEGTAECFHPVNSSKNTMVFRFTWQGRDYYLKHYLFMNWRRYFSLRRKVEHLPRIADQLRQSGFHTPAIVCIAFRGRRMFSVSEAVEADCSVKDLYLENPEAEALDAARLRTCFGREIGRLHASGFVHGDLRWGNILVKGCDTDAPEFIYLDNDRTRRYGRLPARARIRNLVQIHFPEILNANPPSDWKEFWSGYCATNPTIRERETYWHRRAEKASERRVRKWYRKPDCQERLSRRTQRGNA